MPWLNGRPRLTGLKILQLFLRLLSLLCALGCFETTIYIAVYYSKTNPLLFVALVFCIAIDDAEVLALTSKPEDGIKRLGTWGLMIVEGISLVLFLIAFFVAFMGQFGEAWGKTQGAGIGKLVVDGDEPGAKYMAAQWFLVFSIMFLHVVMMGLCCADRMRTRGRNLNN